MWMCSRCQAINDGDGIGGEVCPKCGSIAPERTLPPRHGGMAIAPSDKLASPTSLTLASTNGSVPVAEPIPVTVSGTQPVSDRSSATVSSDATPKFDLDDAHEEELSEEEYRNVTAQSQILKSPLVAIAIILVAVVVVGVALYNTTTQSDESGAIIGPSMIMTQIIASRHSLSEGVSGTWFGTDSSVTPPSPVTYNFQPAGVLTISAADGTDTQATYKVVSNSVQIQSSSAAGQTVLETDKATRSGATLTLYRPAGPLVLSLPETVTGNWVGNMPTATGLLRLSASFKTDGSVTLSGISAGKPQSVSGTYAVFGKSMLIHVTGPSAIAAPLTGNTKLSFDGAKLVIIPDTTTNPAASGPIELTRQ